jgi:SAM-dependent methyltransferase
MLGQAFGKHVHSTVLRHAMRGQNHSTFFLRNRAELQLMGRLASQKTDGSNLKLCVVACSIGAEVYSILWTIRSTRPDLKVKTYAIDIAQDVVDFAQDGIYPRDHYVVEMPDGTISLDLYQHMSAQEMAAMFDVDGSEAKIKPWLKEGITWRASDANDPALVLTAGPQDIVVANRFLCHLRPQRAESCLRNVARLVKPGGYLFVSGVDLDVRIKVARDMGWNPVSDLIREVHEGDHSLAGAWPLDYWGIEPFSETHPDWKMRYASAFQVGEASPEPAAGGW